MACGDLESMNEMLILKDQARTIISPRITGVQINYYFGCRRKLWLFSRGIQMEHESDLVYQGKVIHETSYERARKEVEIDQIKLDFLDISDGVLHEVKKSDKWSEAHEWQVLYYLYVLKEKGITGMRGELDYPVIRRTISVELTPEKEQQLEKVLADVHRIVQLPIPPEISVKKSVCRKCSYFELCYV